MADKDPASYRNREHNCLAVQMNWTNYNEEAMGQYVCFAAAFTIAHISNSMRPQIARK